jgi:hypothetical protein
LLAQAQHIEPNQEQTVTLVKNGQQRNKSLDNITDTGCALELIKQVLVTECFV